MRTIQYLTGRVLIDEDKRSIRTDSNYEVV